MRARNCARENYVLFSHENIFLWLKGGLGVIKSMDNLLNFSRLIMMKRENPFHIDEIIRFLYHEIRARALVRAKVLKIWIVEKVPFYNFCVYYILFVMWFLHKYDARSEGAPEFRQKKSWVFVFASISVSWFFLDVKIMIGDLDKNPIFIFAKILVYGAPSDRASYV